MAAISAQAVKELRDRTGAGMMDCKRALGDAEGSVDKAVDLLRERGLAKASKREGRATSEGTIQFVLAEHAGGMVELGCETDFVAKTDEFVNLAGKLAGLVCQDESIQDVDALAKAQLDGDTVEAQITAAIAKLGENVVIKRVARLSASPGLVGGYVHAGGKLGVLVALETEATGDELQALAKDVSMHVAAVDPTPLAVDPSGIDQDVASKEREIFAKQAEQSGKPANVVEKILEGRMKKFFSEVCLLQQAFVKDPDRSVSELLADSAKSLGSDVAVRGFARFKLGAEESA